MWSSFDFPSTLQEVPAETKSAPSRILVVFGEIVLTACVSLNVYGPQEEFVGRLNFVPSLEHRSLTVAAL
jgi:hypothetical protein